MNYYFSTTIKANFKDIIEKTTQLLNVEGFGVLTQINIQETFKAKLEVDFPKYIILGACNPQFAHKALSLENKVGTMLPCNVIIQELKDGRVEVAAVNPEKSMQAIENPALKSLANEVSEKLKRVIQKLENEK